MKDRKPPQVSRCPDFAELIRAQPADDSLFEQIVACFSQWLTTTARYTCRDEHLAEDAFQEAMIAVRGNLDTYRGEAPIEPWLRKIVFSSCSRLRRGKKNDPRLNISVDGRELGDRSVSESQNQEQRLLLQEKFGRLIQVIDQLEEPNRSLLLLHDSGEQSIGELAGQFAMTEDAVKSRLKRARKAVRELLVSS